MPLSHHPPPATFLLPLFLLLFLPLPITSVPVTSPFSGDYNCSTPPVKQRTPGCLSRLRTHANDYLPCKNSTCYLFVKEPPFIILPSGDRYFTPQNFTTQTPFPCGQFASRFPGLSGIALHLHAATSSRSNLCMWAGHADHCTFNELVSFTQEQANSQYRFAITGLLLETPNRQCHHEASAAIVDNSVIVIGPRKPRTVESPWNQLISPFHWGAWLVFVGIGALFFTTAIIIRFYGFRNHNGASSIVTSFFIFVGSRGDVLAHELDHKPAKRGGVAAVSRGGRRRARRTRRWTANGRPSQAMNRALSFSTHYQVAMKLYRIAIVAILGIFVLFYEVAVVNVLFQQQQSVLEKSVQTLTDAELKDYAVLKDSALENVWQETVGRANVSPEAIPWKRCPTATQCIEMANNGTVKFVVSFEAVGKYLLKELSSCDKLTIYHTKDRLFQFNGGWLYNDQVADEDRKQVDRELIALRANGTTGRFIDDAIGDFSCPTEELPYIGPMIILVPCVIFVVPPLVLAVVVLMCHGRRRDDDMEDDEIDMKASSRSIDRVTKGDVVSNVTGSSESSSNFSRDKESLDMTLSSDSSSLAIFSR